MVATLMLTCRPAVTAPVATHLHFSTKPSHTTAGAVIAPAVQVSIRDADGKTVPDYTGSVRLEIGTNPGGAALGGATTAIAVSGVATFADLVIERAANGYRLIATAPGLAAATSSKFDILGGVATQLALSVEPTTTAAGDEINPAVRVAGMDALGNTAEGYTGDITVAITPGTGTPGAILSGTTTLPASGGVAVFSDLSIDLMGTGYTLSVTAGGLTGVTTAPFDVIPGSANQLMFTDQPSNTTAGEPIAPSVVVIALDALGNPATDYTGNVTVELTAGTGTDGAKLSGTRTVAAVAGVATFGDLTVDKSGTGYTLSARASNRNGDTSTAFDVAPAAVSQLVFTEQPATTTAGVTIAPPVQVAAQDAFDNTVPSFTADITLSIEANPGAGTLTGTTTVATVEGVATFPDLSIDKVGTGYRLAADGGGLNQTSNAFSITVGAATRLAFTVEPTTTTAGNGISPSVRVTALDDFGNTDDSYVGDITVAITPGTGTPGATLAGTMTAGAVGGVAVFSDLLIDLSGTGYTLTATASGLTETVSAPFDIIPGSANRLIFTGQPSNTIAGESMTPPVEVIALDAEGNTATDYTGNVTVELTAGTGTSGAKLAGTRTVAAVAGVATFADLSVDKSGTGYTLSARASGRTGTVSTPFDVAPAAVSQLVFTEQPVTTTAGATIAPPVQVAAQDAFDNTVPSFTSDVTLSIGTNPGGGSLAGTTTVAPVQGVATFPDLSIDKVGTGYRLVANGGGLNQTSNAFSIRVGAATRLAFTVEPTTTTAGNGISPSVRVTALDDFGNTDDSYVGDITVAITPGTGTPGATLAGTMTAGAAGGVAVFSDLWIDLSGTGYTLTATASGLTETVSAPFDIIPGSANRLIFTGQPSNTIAGESMTPPVEVIALDAEGNTATDYTGNVTVELTTGTGTSGAKLAGTRTVAAVAGVATFADLSVDKSGTGYTLSARASGRTGTVSTPFDVAPGALSQLVFTEQPVTTTAGASIAPPVQVAAQDAFDNTVPSFTGDVTLSIGTNPSGGTLAGTTTVAAVQGVATFADLSIDKVGTGYRLVADGGGLNQTSNAFSITPATATRLVFTVEPTTRDAGATISPAVKVTALDAFGNTADGYTGDVTVSITPGTGTPGATLSGTMTVPAVGGVATFSDLSIDTAGDGYTLSATAAGLTGVTSAPFDITATTATHLVFTGQPSDAIAGEPFNPSVVVTARDALGNTAIDYSGNVTVELTAGTGSSGASLLGTRTVAAVAGIATFADLSVDKSGTGYTLSARASNRTGDTSTPFDITPAAVSQLVFTGQPVTTTAGVSIAPPVQVAAQDAFDNTVPSFTGDVTLSIGTNPSGGTLAGTTTAAAVQGVATFSDVSIDKVGTGYRLAADGSGLNQTSNAFSITAGAATQLVFTVEPTTRDAGATITPSVRVAGLDAFGNSADGYTGDVTVSITPGTGTPGATLSGTMTVPAVGGVATFSDLSIDTAGEGYALSATAAGLTGATSAPFDITATTATHLVFTGQPSDAIAGEPFNPSVVVTARDALGNTAIDYSGNVTVELTTGTGTSGASLLGTRTVAAVAGIATFADLSVDKSGTGYTLSARASNRTGDTSTPFDITPAAVSQLVFTGQPVTTTAGVSIAPPVQVAAQDAFDNTVPSFTGDVTLSIGTNPGGGTLGGTTTAAAVQGVATFADISIDKVGTGYRLAADGGGLNQTSNAFSITPAPATQLVFTVEPTTRDAGATITPAVRVAALDAFGNSATSFVGDVTIAIGTNPGGGTLSGTTTVGAVGGVATFSDLSIDKSGAGYTLSATAAGVTGATSVPFDITATTATHLIFTGQPSDAIAGEPFSPSVVVTARDALGNTATDYAGNVTVELTTGTGTSGASLLGTRTVAAVAGIATFADLSVDKSGTGYTLSARASNRTGDTSTPFDITPAAVSQLVFTAQPVTTTAGVSIAPPVQVAAQDAFDNTVPSFTGDVTLSIETNPGGGTLAGTTTVAAVQGIATFADVSIDKVGTGYRLAADGAGLNQTSNAFSITPAPATQLVFTVEPTTTEAGKSISPPIRVTGLDAFGNTATSFVGDVTIAIGTNPGGGTLSGSTAMSAVAGVATFSDLSIDRSGTGYTLTASASGLTGAVSGPFDIFSGTATYLIFTGQPSDAIAGEPFNPSVELTARDAQGNTATDYSGNVTVELTTGTGTSGASLLGTRTVAAVAGIATFADLSVDKSGTGYTLSARASNRIGDTSTPFDITPAAVSQLIFTAQPMTTTAGATITPAVQVAARDAFDNTVPSFTSDVTLTIGTNPGGGTLAGTTTVAAVQGVATFADLSIDKVGTGYRLAADGGGLNQTSNAFSITAGPATQLAFTVEPTSAEAGKSISPSVRVAGLDAFGNTATSFGGDITIAIAANPGGGTLSGTTTVPAVNGVAIFSGLSIDKVGTGYTLQATATSLTPATSTPFDIVPASADLLVFTAQPSNATAGEPITPAIQVTARDAQGNTATDYVGNVTLVITGGTGTPGAKLSGTRTVGAVAGVATFSDVNVDKSGTGYTLTATASGLTATVSAPFDITAAAVSQLVFTAQPATTTAGVSIAPPVQVAAQDAFDNTVPSFTGNVTLTIGANPGGGTLTGTTTVAAVQGVATFDDLSIDKAGTGYRLVADGGGLNQTSNAFSITAGTATQLVFTVEPTTTEAAKSISPSVRVAGLDAFGNTATSYVGDVTIAIETNPGGGTLSGMTTVGAANGVAIFSGLSIDKVGAGYTLQATATSLAAASSAAFDIIPASADLLVFTAQPGNTTAGDPITPAIQVTARDAQGNTATDYVGNVTLVITGGTGSAGATLSGTKTVGAVAGVATFSDLSIDKSGTGYTLTASASGLTATVSTPFDITAGAAAALIFTMQPSDAVAGEVISPSVQVTAQDAMGNIVTDYTGAVTVAITAGSGTSGATLFGTKTVAAVGGVATFSDLSIDKRGADYRLTATDGGLTPDTSTLFAISAGAATQLDFTVQPTTTTAGATITPAVEVTARDAFGNPADGYTGDITITIGTNPSGGTLSGTTTVAAVNGVAIFGTLSIDLPGVGYRLEANAIDLTAATSIAFSIN